MARRRAERDIIVIGASAGGLNVVIQFLRGLPAELRAAIFIVIHMAADNPGGLPGLLEQKAAFPCRWPRRRERIQFGTVYVAPPDHHLILKRGYVCATRGPRENGFRPAVDPLFRTAAAAYGPRVIGIVLSGGLDDGTYGLVNIKREGGLAIAQDPQDAAVSSMPASAIAHVNVDYIVRSADLAPLVAGLVHQRVSEGVKTMRRRKANLVDIAEKGAAKLQEGGPAGALLPLTCPECGGSLWEERNGESARYSCHVGHSYSQEALGTAQSDSLEAALWTAVRALEEYAALRRRMAARARSSRFPSSEHRYTQQAKEAERKAALIRELLTRSGPTPERDVDEPRTKPKARGLTTTRSTNRPEASAGGRGRRRRHA